MTEANEHGLPRPRRDQTTYGEVFASVFDRHIARRDTEDCLRLLRSRIGPRAADLLDLGSGTGRIGIPLATDGHRVTGIEISERMITALRAKPGGTSIQVIQGDLVEVDYGGPYDVVYAADGVLTDIRPWPRLVATFEKIRKALRPTGTFICDGGVPPVAAVSKTSHQVDRPLSDGAHLTADFEHDAVDQFCWGTVRVTLADGTFHEDPAAFFGYLWCEQLDDLARRAGFELVDRFGDWSGSEFTAGSRYQVSIYART
ncbi:class I SAM-dependent DNA methyltransferase [Kribbella sp. DT2]|uniref:class I SAM-dependent DNA methyltransferase n=1 Tax=Kribbella sp. DT2 TaxID=3393427 RepID=UPI003CEE6EAA